MSYPESIDRFSAKLNKKPDGIMHVVEEEVTLENGLYEGVLAHDNIANNSLKVYTGSKYTGSPVSNFTVSIPSDTPWKRYIKIFSSHSKVYVTYQTPGDTVEAEDINKLQEGITASQEEIERYKNEVNVRLIPSETKLAGVAPGAGTAGSATDAVTGSRTISDTIVPTGNTGTLTTLFSWLAYMIKGITGKSSWRTSPSKTLEDLNSHIGAGEMAHANVTANGAAGFMSGVDKAKLDTVAPNANNYAHPASHPSSIITQDASNRFVTDAEKAAWNGKQNAHGFTPENAAKKGVANGYAELDAGGRIPDSRISSTFVTQSQLGAGGYGDMSKGIYDTNNNGKVDMAETAETVAWAGISGRPATFPAAIHKTSHTLNGSDPLTPADIGAMPRGPLIWNQLKEV